MRSFEVVACCVALGVAACGGERRPVGEGPYARQIADAIPKIEKAVGLKFKTQPKVEARTKQQVRTFLEEKFKEDLPAAQLEGERPLPAAAARP